MSPGFVEKINYKMRILKLVGSTVFLAGTDVQGASYGPTRDDDVLATRLADLCHSFEKNPRTQYKKKSWVQIYLQRVLELEGFDGYSDEQNLANERGVPDRRGTPLFEDLGYRGTFVRYGVERTAKYAARVAMDGLRMLRAIHRVGVALDGKLVEKIVELETKEITLRSLNFAKPLPRFGFGDISTALAVDDVFQLAELVLGILSGKSLPSSDWESKLHLRLDDVANPEHAIFNEFYSEMLGLCNLEPGRSRKYRCADIVPDYEKWIDRFSLTAGREMKNVSGELDMPSVLYLHQHLPLGEKLVVPFYSRKVGPEAWGTLPGSRSEELEEMIANKLTGPLIFNKTPYVRYSVSVEKGSTFLPVFLGLEHDGEGISALDVTEYSASLVAVRGLQMLKALHEVGMVHGGDLGRDIKVNKEGLWTLGGLEMIIPFVSREGRHFPIRSCLQEESDRRKQSPSELLGHCPTRADDIFHLAELVLNMASRKVVPSDVLDIQKCKIERFESSVDPFFMAFYNEALELSRTDRPDYEKWMETFSYLKGLRRPREGPERRELERRLREEHERKVLEREERERQQLERQQQDPAVTEDEFGEEDEVEEEMSPYGIIGEHTFDE